MTRGEKQHVTGVGGSAKAKVSDEPQTEMQSEQEIRRRVCERERASATESERAGTVWESEDGRSVDESVRGEK